MVRRLFCERKTWDASVIEFSATTPYIGQQTFGMKRTTTNGPLNVCKVGFDVFSYMTRQNVLAPCLAGKVHKNRRFSTSDGRPPATDGMGYAKMDQIRPKLKFVSIIPGIDTTAPERTETSSGF